MFLILVFTIFIFQKFHLCLFDDFSAKANPNSVIFYSMDSSSSPLFENIKFSNFYHHFIIRFDQIRRDLKIFFLFPCGFNPYLPLYPSICDLVLKWVSFDILTLDHVFSTTLWSRFVKWHHCRGIKA